MEEGKAVDDTERRVARALELRGRRARLRPSPRQQSEASPFDLIGDIHGCLDTSRALLARLGYESVDGWVHRHPEGRRALFLGDYIDPGASRGYAYEKPTAWRDTRPLLHQDQFLAGEIV